MRPCKIVGGLGHERGYRRLSLEGGRVYAHVAAWQAAFGPVPAGLVLHHVCENTACSEVEHLALVAPSTHGRLHHPRKLVEGGVCPAGHALVGDNVGSNGGDYVRCRQCHREEMRELRSVTTR